MMIPERPPGAQAAFDSGLAAETAGDLVEARRLYEYAQRLAPADREITFAIGSTRLRQRDPIAAEPFELLARRDNLREAWLCLVKVRMMAGYQGLAAVELQQALANHAPPNDNGVHSLCMEVAVAVGRPGWCGLSGDGLLRVGLRPGLSATDLHLRLDEQTVSLPVPDASASRDDTTMTFKLPARWRSAGRLRVEHEDAALIGSGIKIAAIAKVEGFVATRDGGLAGWVWQPGDPDLDPVITVRAVDGTASLIVVARDPGTPTTPMTRPRAFHLDAARLTRFSGAVEVVGPDGRNLYGSPVDPGQERRSAAASVAFVRRLFPASLPGKRSAKERGAVARPIDLPGLPADIIGPKPTGARKKRPVDVVIPVYRGLGETMACISSVLETVDKNVRVLVVDDCSPDPELVTALLGLAAAGRIVLHRQKKNGGFPAAANAGMRLAGENDVVLLNSDTLCPPGWLTRLRAAVASAPDIGSATPLSNDATVLSYPRADAVNPIPNLAETIRLDAIAAECSPNMVIDIPTGIGFCMYIRRDCLDQTGVLREDVFAQGYGEENDFCIRARHIGWRHVAVPGVFVGHVGGQSFGAAKSHLIERNLWVLNRLHPGYEALVHEWLRRDPLREVRRRMDIARWHPEGRQGAVVLITHDREGGVRRHVLERAADVRAGGGFPILLSPIRQTDGRVACAISDASDQSFPSLNFALPDQLADLVDFLRRSNPTVFEVHHTIGHDRSVMELPAKLGVPYEVVLHDYSWICPRINLVGADKRYCGEPNLDGCEACYADLGSTTGERIRPTDLVRRSAAELGGARRLIAPSADLAKRLQRHLPGLRPEVRPWEDDKALPTEAAFSGRPAGSPVRVVVVGAIGIEKGFDYLLACARDARSRSLGLEFAVVGYTCGDQRMHDAGVSITGPYDENEVVGLIRAQQADLAFLPSLWPETWSYTLGQAWRAGLQMVAFNIGAPADRLRATGRGLVLPLGIPPAVTNNALFNAGQQIRALVPTPKKPPMIPPVTPPMTPQAATPKPSRARPRQSAGLESSAAE